MTRTSPVPDLGLTLPARSTRPAGGGRRTAGLTFMIDPGLPLGRFTDVVDSHGELVDLVKFGWCTALVAPELVARKVEALAGTGVEHCLGGTLLERVLAEVPGATTGCPQREVDAALDRFTRFCEHFAARCVEVSDGTVPLSPATKARAIAVLGRRFRVLSEVGDKDGEAAEAFAPAAWVEGIRADLDAGAELVITESRESGSSGIARGDGTLRTDVVDAITAAGIDPARLVFEAPTKSLQVEHVSRFGPEVNLGNIAAADLVGLETLRRGLRSDTLLPFLPAEPSR